MIAKEKLVNIIEHAMIAEYRRDTEKEAMLMKALISLDEEEIKDVAGLMIIGRNEQRCKIDEDCYYDNFEDYFHDAREKIYHLCSGNKHELADYMMSKAPLVRYLEDGYKNLYSNMIDKDGSSEMNLNEGLELVERTAMECRIAALKHDRFRTEPEDREELKNLLNTMSGKDIADITWIVVRGSRSYGEPAMLFVSKEEMCSYLCDKTDDLPSYIVEGCIIYNMKWPYSADLDEEYNRYRDRLEEKLAYEE